MLPATPWQCMGGNASSDRWMRPPSCAPASPHRAASSTCPSGSSAVPAVVDIDPLRIAIDTRAGGIGGHAARQLLFHEYRIHTEMATDSAVVAVIGAGAAPDIPRVLTALHELPDQDAANSPLVGLPESGPTAMTLRQAYFAPAEAGPRRARGRPGLGRLAGRLPARHPQCAARRDHHRRCSELLAQHRRIPIRTRPRRRGPAHDPVPSVDRRLTDTVHLLRVHERGGPPRSLHPPPTAP